MGPLPILPRGRHFFNRASADLFELSTRFRNTTFFAGGGSVDDDGLVGGGGGGSIEVDQVVPAQVGEAAAAAGVVEALPLNQEVLALSQQLTGDIQALFLTMDQLQPLLDQVGNQGMAELVRDMHNFLFENVFHLMAEVTLMENDAAALPAAGNIAAAAPAVPDQGNLDP